MKHKPTQGTKQMKTISLQMVAVIDGKMTPIKDIHFTKTIADAIEENYIADDDTEIVEYLTEIAEELYDHLSDESHEFRDDDAGIYIGDYHI